MLVDVVTATLGVRDQSARPPPEVLIEFLSSRQLLLVLDNCEQAGRRRGEARRNAVAVLPARYASWRPAERRSASSAKPWSHSPRCRVRRPTPSQHLSGPATTRWRCSPNGPPPRYPGLSSPPTNTATIAQICSRLDGLPLAIELAAARLRAMSPEQILDRLSDRFTLLTRGSRRAPTRQQTLAWSIGWSYDLCTPGRATAVGTAVGLLRKLRTPSGRSDLRLRHGGRGLPRSGVVACRQVDPAPNRSTRCGPAPVARHRPRLRKRATRADRRIPSNCGDDTSIGIASWRATPKPDGSAPGKSSGWTECNASFPICERRWTSASSKAVRTRSTSPPIYISSGSCVDRSMRRAGGSTAR